MGFMIFLDIEIDRSLAHVSEAIVEDLLHKGDLLDDVARGVRFDAGRQYVERLHRMVVAQGVILDNLHRLQLLEACFLGDLVLTLIRVMLQMANIGDVTHVAYLVAQVSQIAEQKIERDGGTSMTEMRVAINGWSADIHADVWCV